MGASAMLGMMEEERKYMVEMGFCDCGHYNALHVRRLMMREQTPYLVITLQCPILGCKCANITE